MELRLLNVAFHVFVISSVLFGGSTSAKSRIVFQNGVYNNITVALDGSYHPANCKEFINMLNKTLTEASNGLSDALDGKARLGKIRVIIPADWRGEDCTQTGEIPKEKEVYESYESADIKLTANHSIAIKLPWAEQRKGCGESGEAIYVPPDFFTSTEFNDVERGKLLLHEWLKFRYGVFEEFGFLDDEYYFPCYKRNGGIHYTSCTNPPLGELSNKSSISAVDCKSLMGGKNSTILKELQSTTSSLMFGPHIVGSANPKLCSSSTHNSMANTKQNLQCFRKSVGNTVLSHRDFSGTLGTVDSTAWATAPEIELVQPRSLQTEGYAFLVEMSEQSEKMDRLRLVKQSVAEFVYFIEESGNSHTICLATFGDSERECEPTYLGTLQQKKNFLAGFYETISSEVSNSSSGDLAMSEGNGALTKLRTQLEGYPQRRWNIVFIAASNLTDMDQSLEVMKGTGFSISVVTFDESKTWLLWNSLMQTRQVLYLPSCTEQIGCGVGTRSILTEHLLEILGDQRSRRFFRKPLDVEVKGDQSLITFSLPAVDGRRNWILSIHSVFRYPEVSLTSPSGSNCQMTPLLNYDGVLHANVSATNCVYESGTWRLSFKQLNPASSYAVRSFVETEKGLLLIPSFTSDLSKEILPSQQNFLVPVQVAVKTPLDQPVIGAKVEVEIIYVNITNFVATRVTLTDDGAGPDVTRDDGVYAGYVRGFSANPTFHSGRVHVETVGASVVTGLEVGVNEPALFEARMATKCCGSYVPAIKGGEVSLGRLSWTTLIPSFRTGETMDNPEVFPPSRIDLVEVTGETDNDIDLKFSAPSGDFSDSPVDHYDICLACDQCLCKPIPTESCSPVVPNGSQLCLIPKVGLVETFVDAETIGNNTGEYVTLRCAIRAVNKWNLTGPLSFSEFEISLYIASGEEVIQPTCESILDDNCLPGFWFWVLIGIIAALFLLVLITNIAWCCCSRRKQEAVESPRSEQPASRNGNLRLSSVRRTSASPEGKTSEGGFIIRPVYTSPLEQDSEQSSSDIIQTSLATQKNNGKIASNQVEVDRDVDEMPVYFGTGSKQKPPVPKKPQYTNHRSDYDLRSYPSRQMQDHLSVSTLPTVSSTVDARKSREDWSQIPIYATVSRNARRQDRNFGIPLPVLHPGYVNDPVRNPNNIQQPEKYTSVSRPHSAQSLDSGFARSQSQLSSPPIIRMDHFPSSESETYSEMSRGVPVPPPPPPPLPSAADLNSATLRRRNEAQTIDQPDGSASRNDLSSRPVPLITPPKENAFGVLAKMGPIPDRRSILKPRGGLPPPPPPRKNSSGRFNDSNIVNSPLTQNQLYSSQGRGTEPGLNDNHTADDYDDDDSDNWDFYDDFDFNPGVSHV